MSTPAENLEGVQPAETAPAAPPEAVTTEANTEATTSVAPVEQPQSAEQVAPGTPEAKDESTQAASEGQDDAQESSDVRRQARKLWAEVNELGGPQAFEVAKALLTTYFSGEKPAEFVQQLQQYPTRYAPVRDEIVYDAIKRWPTEFLGLVREAHPNLKVTFGAQAHAQQPQSQAEQSSAADPVAWANEVLADSLANEQEKAAARHILSTQEQLGKLPQLEQKVNAFDGMVAEQKQAAVRQAETKYLDEVAAVVDETFKQAGLETVGEDPDDFRDLVRLRVERDEQTMGLIDQVLKMIGDGDLKSANFHLPRVKARVEKVASDLAKSRSGRAAQKRDLQTQKLTQDPPKVVTGGQTTLSTAAPEPPPFDDAAHWDALQNIKQRIPA